MLQRIRSLGSTIKAGSQKSYISFKGDIQKRPLTNFFLAIGGLILLIILSSVLHQTPKTAVGKDLQSKQVQLYSIGSVPKMDIQAQIEKSGVIKVVALSGGVVQKVHFKEGDAVSRGSTLVSLGTNYQGGNASSVQRQLAQNQYQAAIDTFGTQNDIINRQRDVATASAQSAAEVRQITNESIGTTRDLLSLNESMLNSTTDNLNQLQQIPSPDQQTQQTISTLQATRAQLLQANAQIRTQLRTSEYQSANDNPLAGLS